jgi:hypothetical protein
VGNYRSDVTPLWQRDGEGFDQIVVGVPRRSIGSGDDPKLVKAPRPPEVGLVSEDNG